MLEGFGPRPTATGNEVPAKVVPQPIETKPAATVPTDNYLKAPNTGPFAPSWGPGGAGSPGTQIQCVPPPVTAEQTAQLAELGITVTGDDALSSADARHAIEYLGSEDRLGTGFLVESMTAPELVETVGLLEDLSAVGVELGQSTYVPGQWSLPEIRKVHGVVDTMADNAESEFLATHSPEELKRVAAYEGLPVERAGDAALTLLLDGDTIHVLRDANANVHYVLNEGSVQNDANGKAAVWRRYEGTDGVWHQYNPLTETPPAGAKTAESVWYARADAADRLVLGTSAFFEGEQNAPTKEGFTYTSDSLVAHEISHNIVGTHPNFSAEFDALSDGMTDDNSRGTFGTADGSSVDLAANSSGYEHAPRSSDAGDEEAADLVTNGLLGTFTNDEAGRARAEQFRTMIGRVFDGNLAKIPADFVAPPEYTDAEAVAPPPRRMGGGAVLVP